MDEALGDRLVGVRLSGSAALGDFAPELSDLDVQAVSTERLALGERRALAESLSHRALPCPARGLEFVLYAQDDLADPAGPAFQLNLNTGPAMHEHVALDPAEDPRFWFTLDVAIGRAHGRTLRGRNAADVLPDLNRDRVLQALATALDWYQEHEGHSADTVLSACRAWAFASDGRWYSKTGAARWAHGRVPHPAVIDRALRLRRGGGGSAIDPGDVAGLVGTVRAALEQAR